MRDVLTIKLKEKEFFGHPSGLYVLFFTEMWERFSYYGMRALLVMYMVHHLLLPENSQNVLGYPILASLFGNMNPQQMSSLIYGWYTGLVYFTPLFGGMLADKLFGQHKTVYVGGVLMAIGHFLMASEHLFLIALLFLILGNGCFKPNISTQVGNLYKADDPRRDSAFSIFYMGINLGATFSPLICGTLGEKVGWHWGFGAAGVGMLIGLFIYWLGADLVPRDVYVADGDKPKTATKEKLSRSGWIAIGSLVVLCILNIIFWSIYEQQGNTLQLWAESRINWNILGFEMPASWYQVYNPLMIFALTPILVNIWARLERKKVKVGSSSISKMGIGNILLGLGFVVMILAASTIGAQDKGSMWWLAASTLIITLGELYLSPIGLSLVTKIAPKPVLSTMMGIWLMSSFFGNVLSGYLGTYFSVLSEKNFFMLMMVLPLITGVLFLLVRKPIESALGRKT